MLEGNAGQDVSELAELLDGVCAPDDVVEAIARWSDARGAEQKWGIIAIEFLRRARHDGTLGERQRQLFISQWEDVGALVIRKLSLETPLDALDLGGIVLELTYGGISSFLDANTPGQMVRHVLTALLESNRLAHAE